MEAKHFLLFFQLAVGKIGRQALKSRVQMQVLLAQLEISLLRRRGGLLPAQNFCVDVLRLEHDVLGWLVHDDVQVGADLHLDVANVNIFIAQKLKMVKYTFFKFFILWILRSSSKLECFTNT